jgi:hypothetical protein
VNKRHKDPTKVRTRPMNEEDVDAVAGIDRRYFVAPQPEDYRAKLDSAAKGAGITSFLVSEERTSESQVDCKG